jgi:hypothetical protein
MAKKSRTRGGKGPAKRRSSVTISIDLNALEKLYKRRYEVSLDGDTKGDVVRAMDGDTKGGLRIRGETKGGPRRPSKKRLPKKR